MPNPLTLFNSKEKPSKIQDGSKMFVGAIALTNYHVL